MSARLAGWRHAAGPVVPKTGARHYQEGALERLRRALGWSAWRTNALRHSFGSNRLAIVGDIAKVSLEIGNSPAQIREHYNDATTASEATRYFAIVPTTPANILPISTAR